MKKRHFLITIALVILIPFGLIAQLPRKVDGENIKKMISIIASDEYQGRMTGTKGCEMAEEFFASEFKKLKLVPMGDNGSYFYNYTIPSREVDESTKPTLMVEDRKFYDGYEDDFRLAYNSDGGTAEGEVVFAGYGIYAPEKRRNDFDSLDIKGKIVLIKRGAPRKELARWMPYCIDSMKAEYCYNNGAVGVLFYEPIERVVQQRLSVNYNNYLANVNVLQNFPVFNVDERVARFILQKTKFPNYRALSRTIESKVQPFNTGKVCKMSAAVSVSKQINTRNVLGMIPGTDSKLKNEYIIIGGHIDHVGVDASGIIRNGADDNASGPSVALGIAQAMVKNKFKPKRSIIFVGWTGEEMGLLGSKAWVQKPTVDIKKVIVYFNLDMVGLGDVKLNMPGTEFAPEVYEFIKSKLDSTELKQINWSKGGLGGSDHNGFLQEGIPAFAGMTSGSHPDYHQPGDDPDKIKADVLQLTGDFIYRCTELLATSKSPFISETRIAENKVKLIEFNMVNPILSANYAKELENKNLKQAFIDFSDRAVSKKEQDNFVELLKIYDEVITSTKRESPYQISSSAYDSYISSWRNRIGLMAAFNPEVINYDEMMIRVIAKYGYRLAVLNDNSIALKDTSILKRLVKVTADNGVGILLNNLSTKSLETYFEVANRPVIILTKDISILSDKMIKQIKKKEHLVALQVGFANSTDQDMMSFETLNNNLGSDLVTIAPIDQTLESYNGLKSFMLSFIRKYKKEDFQSKIFSDNFTSFAAKSLQVNEQTR